jgi:hypothetical protein
LWIRLAEILRSGSYRKTTYVDVKNIGSVPDKRSRILEVIVVRRMGIWSGEGMGKD